MVDDKPTATRDPNVILGWRLSRVFKKPEHLSDVLKFFGPQRQSALRKIIEAVDMMGADYWAARTKKLPKFEASSAKLKRLEVLLADAQAEWIGLRELHPVLMTLRIKTIPSSERKEKADAAIATIDLDLMVKTLLPLIRKLRDPKSYSAAVGQPHGKSYERTYLWEPLMHLMKEYHVEMWQRGVFLGALRSLHLALGVSLPNEVTVRKMRHDLKQDKHSSPRKRYATAKKRPHA
jgi:hypothetical protein